MNKESMKRQLAAFFSSWLPLIISQRLRTILYSKNDGIAEAKEFKKRAVTGGYFVGNTKDFHSHVFSVHGTYTWRNIAIAKALCTNGGDIVEIGANVGTETVCFADIVNLKGSVFAFEPFSANVKWLNKNKNISRFNNIEVFPYAISNYNGEARFVPPTNEHSTGVGYIESNNGNSTETITVPCYRLDEFIHVFSVLNCIFIDIEGADLLAVRGAIKIIELHRPCIVLEVKPRLMEKYNLNIKDLLDEMTNLRYVPHKIGKFRLIKIDVDSINSGDWICIPAENISLKEIINKSITLTAFNPFHLKIRYQ